MSDQYEEYQNFSKEELIDLLNFKESFLAEVTEKIHRYERENELLQKETAYLSNRVSECVQQLNEKNEELKSLKSPEIYEGELPTEEDEIDFDRWCEKNEALAKEMSELASLSSYKRQLYKEVKEFLDTTPYKTFQAEMEKMILGQPQARILLINVYRWLESIRDTKCAPTFAPRLLVSGPSGSGKTHILRCLVQYFNGDGNHKGRVESLKIIHTSLSNVSCSGFKGRNCEAALLSGTEESEGCALIWGSEWDKMVTNPKWDSKGNSVSVETQGEMLQLFEGQVLNYSKGLTINTSHACFVLDGSFAQPRMNRKKAVDTHKIGFQQEEKEEYDIFDGITKETLIEYGCIPELCGRIFGIVNLHPLSEETVYLLIAGSTGYQQRISKELGIDLVLSDGYIADILMPLANGDTGCRQIYTRIFEDSMQGLLSAYELGLYDDPVIILYPHGCEIRESEKCEQESDEPDIAECAVAEETCEESNGKEETL